MPGPAVQDVPPVGLHPLAPGCDSISPCRAHIAEICLPGNNGHHHGPLGHGYLCFLPGQPDHREIDASRLAMAEFIDSA